MSETRTKIVRDLANSERLAFKKHTVLRMYQRHISADEVKEMLLNCELVEDYPRDYPLPSGLFMGYRKEKRPIHAVIELDDETERIWLITVYEPIIDNWRSGFRERRRKDEVPAV